jgi:hypothetical protein
VDPEPHTLREVADILDTPGRRPGPRHQGRRHGGRPRQRGPLAAGHGRRGSDFRDASPVHLGGQARPVTSLLPAAAPFACHLTLPTPVVVVTDAESWPESRSRSWVFDGAVNAKGPALTGIVGLED